MKWISHKGSMLILLLAFFVTGGISTGWAADSDNAVEVPETVIMSIGATQMIVDNAVIKTDEAPLVQNGRTYVQLRALGNIFGAECSYNTETREVTVARGNDVIVMMIGEDAFLENGSLKSMDAAPFITAGGRTMVPVRFVADAFGAVVKLTYKENGAVADIMLQL